MLRSWSVRISLLAVLLLVLGPLLAFTGVVPGGTGMLLFAIAALVGLAGIVAGIVTMMRGRQTPGVLAMGLGAVCLFTVLWPVLRSGGRPPINDISTDLQDVPALTQAAAAPENQGKDLSYPEAFKPAVKQYYPGVEPLHMEVPPEAAFARAVAVARTRPGWEVTRVDSAAHTFEGVARSRIFRFQDDFVVRVRPDGTGSRVDMRSRSRVGRGDLGANAMRIEQYFRELSPPASAR